MSPVNVLDVPGSYTPTLFVGEKVAKPDEGACDGCGNAVEQGAAL